MKRILTTLSRKWPEYLLEILVITIGIYGAFALDNWNEGKKDRLKEKEVLQRLYDDFLLDEQQLQSRMRLRKMVIKSAQSGLDYIDNPENVPADSILKKISAVFFTTTFDPIDHKLMESGNIHLIQNEELKHLLTKWPSDLFQLKEVEYEYINTYRNVIIPFLIETGIGRYVDHALWNNEAYYASDFWLEETSAVPDLIKKPKIDLDPRELLKNRKLESILSNAATINHVCQTESNSLQLRIDKILNLLEKELKK